MLHQVIPSILLILAYVSAAAAAEPVCAEFVGLDVFHAGATDALKKFSGLYQVTDEEIDDKPVYRNEGNTNLCMFTAASDIALGDCHSKALEYTLSYSDTCFSPTMSNEKLVAIDGTGNLVASGMPVAVMDSRVRGADCSECREILAGDFKGNYTLVDKHSPFCHSDTDMCVYANKDTKATVCFEKDDAGGTDTMPHDETCA